jgi:hypothetical protein
MTKKKEEEEDDEEEGRGRQGAANTQNPDTQ